MSAGAPMEQRPQVPPLLRRFDDPWGLTWRASNLARRFSARRTARFVRAFARPPAFNRPVFILGAPRSGTTMLFHALRASPHLGSIGREGHDVWRAFHHPRRNGWISDEVGAGQTGSLERRFVRAFFGSYTELPRFIDKTPENSLRVPYLLDLFPDALFVVIRRNPCDVIHSLITGWKHPGGRYRSYYVPRDLRIPDYPERRRWCFALIEGWEKLASSPVHRIAFEQWRQCVAALDRDRSLVPPERWTEVHFEPLLASPDAAFERICRAIDIPLDTAVRSRIRELMAEPANALSPPGVHKWREAHSREMAELLPAIATAAPLAGYEVDAATGEFRMIE